MFWDETCQNPLFHSFHIQVHIMYLTVNYYVVHYICNTFNWKLVPFNHLYPVPPSHFTNVYLIVEDRVITIKRRQPWHLKSCSYFFQTKIQLFSTDIWNRDDTRSKVRVTFKRVKRATGWDGVFFKGKQSSDPLILSFLMTARWKVKKLSLSSHMTTYEDLGLLNMVGIVLLSYTCTAAAAKSLQSCPTLCDPIDGSPPGSPIPGILQARTLEWVAISFSNAWKVKVKSLSRVRLLATPWTATYQAPPSMEFSRQEYWSGMPLVTVISLKLLMFLELICALLVLLSFPDVELSYRSVAI